MVVMQGNVPRRHLRQPAPRAIRERHKTLVPFESFRCEVEARRFPARKSNAGRKPFAAPLISKVHLLTNKSNTRKKGADDTHTVCLFWEALREERRRLTGQEARGLKTKSSVTINAGRRLYRTRSTEVRDAVLKAYRGRSSMSAVRRTRLRRSLAPRGDAHLSLAASALVWGPNPTRNESAGILRDGWVLK
jgi:hypothetical protein